MWQNARYGLRMLAKAQGLTAVAVLTLGLGIGANAAIFSVIDAVLLRPLPFTNPDQLVVVWETNPLIGEQKVSVPDFYDWQRQNRVFGWLAAYTESTFSFRTNNKNEELHGFDASSDLFSLLGISPFLGRYFTAREEEAGANVLLIGYPLWLHRFHGDPRIVGKPIVLDGVLFTIIGVAPPNLQMPAYLQMPSSAQVWVPLAGKLTDPDRTIRAVHILNVIGRVKVGVSMHQANTDMQTVVKSLQHQFPNTNGPTGCVLVPLTKQMNGDAETALLALQIAVGLILLIACSNVASLLLARGAAREKEMAIRCALGASGARLLRQLLTESLLMSFLGGILGVLLAWIATIALRTYSASVIPRAAGIKLNPTIFAITFGLCIVTAFLSGVTPALHLARPSLGPSLRQDFRITTGKRQFQLRNLLVILQIALAVVVLIGSGLLTKSFAHLLDTSPGFRTSHLLVMDISLSDRHYTQDAAIESFYKRLLPSVRSLPGVEEAATVSPAPFTSASARFSLEDLPDPAPGHFPDAQIRIVTPEYFRVLSIPILKGRLLSEGDCLTDRVVINHSMMYRYFKDKNPIGRNLVMGFFSAKRYDLPIVGVVSDTRDVSLDKSPEPTMYMCGTSASATLLVRTKVDPMSLVNAAQSAVYAVDPNAANGKITSMDQIISALLATRRFSVTLFGIFAALAALLAVIGISGVMSDFVSERTREIGIRIALGAHPRKVMLMVVSRGVKLACIGVTIGLAASFGVTRFVASLLYGVGTTDPVTFFGTAILLIFLSVAAVFIPARRAMTVDPIITLRHE